MQDRAAGIAEERVDTLAQERLAHHLRAGHGGRPCLNLFLLQFCDRCHQKSPQTKKAAIRFGWRLLVSMSIEPMPSSASDKKENRNNRNDDDGGRNPRSRDGDDGEWSRFRHVGASV
jgi:hypothetical protein